MPAAEGKLRLFVGIDRAATFAVAQRRGRSCSTGPKLCAAGATQSALIRPQDRHSSPDRWGCPANTERGSERHRREVCTLIETAYLRWFAGDSIGPDSHSLWVSRRLSGVQDDTVAMRSRLSRMAQAADPPRSPAPPLAFTSWVLRSSANAGAGRRDPGEHGRTSAAIGAARARAPRAPLPRRARLRADAELAALGAAARRTLPSDRFSTSTPAAVRRRAISP